MDHATIIVEEEEEARPDPYQVKVEFEDVRLGHETMIFDVTPGEKVSSLKARVATQLGLFAPMILLRFNGNVPTGYSFAQGKAWISKSQKIYLAFISAVYISTGLRSKMQLTRDSYSSSQGRFSLTACKISYAIIT